MRMRPALLAFVALLVSCGGSSPTPEGTPGGGSGGPGNDDAGGATSDAGGPGPDGGAGTDSGGAGNDASPPVDSGTALSCTGLRYCDNFEAYSGAVANNAMLGPWKAAINGAGTAVAVDTVKPYSGAKSLHITIPAGAAARGTLGQSAAAGLIPGNNMFGRAMVFYSNAGTNGLPLGVHSWLFNSAGTSTAANGNVTMNMGGGGAKMQLNYHPPAPATEQSVQGGTMTAGAWHCVQWQYDGSGTPAKDEARVWVDGTLAVNVPATKGWNLATPWSAFDFGFTHYQTLANPVEIHLDDFALSDAMIACP